MRVQDWRAISNWFSVRRNKSRNPVAAGSRGRSIRVFGEGELEIPGIKSAIRGKQNGNSGLYPYQPAGHGPAHQEDVPVGSMVGRIEQELADGAVIEWVQDPLPNRLRRPTAHIVVGLHWSQQGQRLVGAPSPSKALLGILLPAAPCGE